MKGTRRSSSRPTSSTCATAGSAGAPTNRLQRLRAAARHRLDGHAEDGDRVGGGIYYVRDIGNAVFDTVRNAPFTIRATSRPRTSGRT